MASDAQPLPQPADASARGGEQPEGSAAGASTLGAAFNMLCVVIGTGMLQLPYGLRQSGWLGLPLLLLMSAMACYTAVVLGSSLGLARQCLVLRIQDYPPIERTTVSSPASSEASTITVGGALAAGTPLLVQSPVRNRNRSEAAPVTAAQHSVDAAAAQIRSYGDIGHEAFGWFGRWFVVVQMHLTLLLVGTIYHLLTSINLVDLLSTNESNWLGETRSVLLVGGLLWFHVFLKTLSEVAVISYFNMMISVALLVVVISQAVTHPPTAPVSHTFLTAEIRSFGSAFASFGFAYGVHPMIPSIIESMRSPSQFTYMACASFAGVLCFYVPIVVVGYSIYGDDVASPIYETEPLKGAAAVKIIIGCLSAHLLMAYPIVFNPPERALETSLGIDQYRRPLFWRIVLRSAFVLFSTGVALLVRSPKRFGPFLDLVSACTSTFTVFILPSVFYMKLQGIQRLHRAELAWNVLIIFVSLFGAVFGSIDAIEALIKSYR